MKVQVLVTKYDLLTQEVETLAKGQGSFHDSVLTYYELENPVIKHEITFLEDKVYLRRKAEIESEVELIRGEIGCSKVHSPYGTMELESVLHTYEKGESDYLIEYSIRSDNEVLSHQKILFELTKD